MKEVGHPKRTLLDYDHSRPVSLRKIAWVSRTIQNKVKLVRYDRTTKGYHVIIHWERPMDSLQILALQAILGSDYRRESLNWFRLDSGIQADNWNILYSNKLYT